MASLLPGYMYSRYTTRSPIVAHVNHQKPSLPSTEPIWKSFKRPAVCLDAGKLIRGASQRVLDAFVDASFQFVDQPLAPSQSNFAPVDEIGNAIILQDVEGEIPHDFPEGVYMRIGSNPLHGAQKSVVSVFGVASETWVEGEGMIHAINFTKNVHGKWVISYKNKYVESETFRLEKERKKPLFMPTAEGDPAAILTACFLNSCRFGKVNKDFSNTNIFEHSGRYYAITESHLPEEVDIINLETRGSWDISGTWNRPFCSHPKRVPKTGELLFIGADATKPFLVLGLISADGKNLLHKIDLNFKRSILNHDVGVTKRYNIILDMPLIMDVSRVIRGGALIKYEDDSYARIGVMPRYGDAASVKWFKVEQRCVFHVLNSYEDGFEVVVLGFSAKGSMIPGPELGRNKNEWFSKGFQNTETEDGLFFSRLHEWRLNMKTGETRERYLTGKESSMEFPMINEKFIGVYNKYGYAQVGDLKASCECAKAKFGSLAKLYLEKDGTMSSLEGDEVYIKTEYHQLEKQQFCSGAAFVSKLGSRCDEDDGWIVTFVHNEDTDTSQVHIIDCKSFSNKPVAKITLPVRVPYGFHGAFFHKPKAISDSGFRQYPEPS